MKQTNKQMCVRQRMELSLIRCARYKCYLLLLLLLLLLFVIDSREVELTAAGLLWHGGPHGAALPPGSGGLTDQDDLNCGATIGQTDPGCKCGPVACRYRFHHWVFPLTCAHLDLSPRNLH